MIGSLKRTVKRILLQRSSGALIEAGVEISQSSLGRSTRIGRDSVVIRSTIGDFSYVGPRSVIASATIGRFCSIASEVHVGTGSHPSRGFVSMHPAFYLSRPELGWSFISKDKHDEFRPTQIGSDVWLGAKSVIRDGVCVGDGAIIGAGAIVVKDIEPFGIYGGVPARLIRFRFSPEEIADLLESRWWDRDDTWLREHAHLFDDVARFRSALSGQSAEAGH